MMRVVVFKANHARLETSIGFFSFSLVDLKNLGRTMIPANPWNTPPATPSSETLAVRMVTMQTDTKRWMTANSLKNVKTTTVETPRKMYEVPKVGRNLIWLMNILTYHGCPAVSGRSLLLAV